MAQTVIILVLAAVAIAAVIVAVRLSRTRSGAIDASFQSSLASFLESLDSGSNSSAWLMSFADLLRDGLSCEKVAVLLSNGNQLRLWRSDDSTGNPGRLEIGISHQLSAFFLDDPAPRALRDIAAGEQSAALAAFTGRKFNWFFCITWRKTLLGVCLVQRTAAPWPPGFELARRALGQALAGSVECSEGGPAPADLPHEAAPRASTVRRWAMPILRLVRHRSAESLVPKLAETLHLELDLEGLVLIHEGRRRRDPVRIHRVGVADDLRSIEREQVVALTSYLQSQGPTRTEELAGATEPYAELAQRLLGAGLSCLVPFPLSGRRAGILAYNGAFPTAAMRGRIEELRHLAQDLIRNAEAYERVEAISFTDDLTGLSNKRFFLKRLQEEIRRAERYGRSLALIMFDLDELKPINDRLGHQAGDKILRNLGRLLKVSIRSIDVIARYGGDEFCIIMPESDAATCLAFMHRLQDRIASTPFPLGRDDETASCTVSLGGAVFPEHGDSAERLVYAADMALLKAKEQGRNRYLLYSQELIGQDQ